MLQLCQIVPYTAHLPSRTCRSWQELNSAQHRWSCGRLFLTPQICHPGPAGPGRSSAALALWQIVPYTAHLPSRTCRSWKELSSARQHWSCGRLLLSPRSCHPGAAGPGRSSTVLSAAGAVADCSLHHRSAIQDLQVLEGAQQRWPCGRLFLTPHICLPGPAGPGRSSAVLGSPGVVADCSLHCPSAIQDLQVLAGAQQRSVLLELWQIVPYTTDLPSRTCRSWKELSSAGPVADCSLHRTSAFQDLQVLEGAQQCSAALELWQIAPYTAHLPSRTCRSWQELNSAQYCWSCGRLFLTPQICHAGPAGPGRSSAALKLWQIVPYTAALPSRTCRS